MRWGLIAVSVLAAGFVFYILARDLVPPKSLVFAAGSEGGGYWQIAERYREILARDGIEVTVLATAGSVENAALMSLGAADIALVQGGIPTEPGLIALGAVFREPMFVFALKDAAVPQNPGGWNGVRTAIGPPGSGTRAAVETLMSSAELPDGALVLDPRGGREAAAALLAGDLDVAVFVAPMSASYLAPLFTSTRVEILELDHIDAISRRLPQSDVTWLPSGALSLDPPLPAVPRHVLSMVATLAAQPDLHPSLIDRLVEAAREIHGARNAITDAGDFPGIEGIALPINAQARDLIENGPSPLHAYLPYWVVAQISRFAILLLPILFLMLPILRILPGLYAWRMRHRVFRHYADISEIEEEAKTAEPARLKVLRDRLDAIDGEIAGLNLPLPYRQVAYTARLHIDLLREKMAGADRPSAGE